MEPRNYESGASESAPIAPETPSLGYPTGGNPGTGTPATKPGPFWFYKIGESIRRVIVSAGLTPSDDNLDLLNDAITAKSSSKASQVEVDAGVNDSKFVTALKLLFGFSISITANGYIVFPQWLKSFKIQWGLSPTLSAGAGEDITFPVVHVESVPVIFSTVTGTAGTTGTSISQSPIINRTSITNSGFTLQTGGSGSFQNFWISFGR